MRIAFLYNAVLLTATNVAIVLIVHGRSALGLLWLELTVGLIVHGAWDLGTALLLAIL